MTVAKLRAGPTTFPPVAIPFHKSSLQVGPGVRFTDDTHKTRLSDALCQDKWQFVFKQ